MSTPFHLSQTTRPADAVAMGSVSASDPSHKPPLPSHEPRATMGKSATPQKAQHLPTCPALLGIILAAIAVGYALLSPFGVGFDWLQSPAYRYNQNVGAVRRFHQKFIGLPSNDSAAAHLRELVKEPHISGSPEDFKA
jgi:hypothetical protein